MIETHTENRQRQKPARMVGNSSSVKTRRTGTDAGNVLLQTCGRAHGRALPLPIFLAIFLCLCFGVASAGGDGGMTSAKRYAPLPAKSAAPQGFLNRQVPGINTMAKPATPEELSAAKGIESLLIQQMIEEMRKTVPENDIIPVTNAEKIYRQMLDTEYARQMSESSSLGIAEMVVAEMHSKR